MRSYSWILAFMFAAAQLLALPPSVQAQQRLVELEGMPFSLAVANRMTARLLPFEDPAGYRAAAVMPRNITELDIVEVTWPRSKRALRLGIGSTGRLNSPREQYYCSISVAVDEGEARLTEVSRSPLPGTLSHLSIWPTSGSDGDLIAVFTLASAAPDSTVYAFRVSPDGAVADVSTGGALTAYGGFEVVDLDSDGSFELVTTRNLDGMPGGFSYKAVRRFDGSAYIADPERYKRSLFQDELVFLDWVVQTRASIQTNPEPYLNKGFYGFFYAAEYKGELYGFDSLIELPQTAGGQYDLPVYNKQRQEAFQRVQAYRDELHGWLNGGAVPDTWKLTR